MGGSKSSADIADAGRLVLSSILEHHGIKGMKWGVRRLNPSGSSGEAQPVELKTKPNGQIKKASGGKHQPANEDAIRTAISKQKAKKSGTQSLSTKELQDLVTRMNLEQQYSTLMSKQPSSVSSGHNAVKQILSVAKTGQEVYNIINSPAGKAATSLGAKLLQESLHKG